MLQQMHVSSIFHGCLCYLDTVLTSSTQELGELATVGAASLLSEVSQSSGLFPNRSTYLPLHPVLFGAV
jgi:hypothetical protein